MKKPLLKITDHAILRYLERAKGMDVEAVRAEIMLIVGPAYAMGATKFSKGGLTYMLNYGVLSTITPNESVRASIEEGYRSNGRTKSARSHKERRREANRRGDVTT